MLINVVVIRLAGRLKHCNLFVSLLPTCVWKNFALHSLPLAAYTYRFALVLAQVVIRDVSNTDRQNKASAVSVNVCPSVCLGHPGKLPVSVLLTHHRNIMSIIKIR